MTTNDAAGAATGSTGTAAGSPALPLPDALDGIRVVCAAINVPGPRAAARLRDMGATLTKVEPPSGDPLAFAAPGWYREMAAGADIVSADLKSAEGRARVDALLAEADVLVTSHRPSALRRMGLADAAVRHPRLCHVEIVGDAGDPERPGHDLTFQADEGLVAAPGLPRTLVADLAGAEAAASAALGMLLRRGRTGEGGQVLVGLRQAADSVADPLRHGLTAPGGVLGGGLPVYGVYEVADGHVAVAALEPHFIRRLAEAIGSPVDAGAGPAAALAAIDAGFGERLAAFLRGRSTESVLRWADDHDLPFAAVR
ncbi:CoA transferase [Corynebacterium sp. 335C]